ncbi:hypothetical protein APED_28780 [Acanthopleuribacter pedis]
MDGMGQRPFGREWPGGRRHEVCAPVSFHTYPYVVLIVYPDTPAPKILKK